MDRYTQKGFTATMRLGIALLLLAVTSASATEPTNLSSFPGDVTRTVASSMSDAGNVVLTKKVSLQEPATPSEADSGANLSAPDKGINAADDIQGFEGDDILDMELDLEQLGNVDVVVPAFDVEVMSVTKRESTIGKSPAAVFVITRDMIRRSGKTTVPALLRMVPGMQVARIDANKWAISSRGFNGRYTNKLLVLVDGRTVYTPIFAGVFWSAQDMVLEDIERIEVIRGPGATLWGANAVNGVINIITRDSKDTQGSLITTGGGDFDEFISSVRHGGQISNNWHYRVFTKFSERDSNILPGGDAQDDWRMQQVGLRADWRPKGCDCQSLTISGGIFDQTGGDTTNLASPTPPMFSTMLDRALEMRGGHMLARWNHNLADDEGYSFQTFFDRYARSETVTTSSVDTFDTEFQYHFSPLDDHSMSVGLHYRLIDSRIDSTSPFTHQFVPRKRRVNLFGGFIQDEIALRDDLRFIVGTKVGHNDFTGLEVQPGGRLIWEPTDRSAAWLSVARAVRTPSIVEDDLQVTGPPTAVQPFLLQLNGGRSIDSEQLTAFELGYREEVVDDLTVDLATFFNHYDDYIGFSTVGFQPFPPTAFLQFTNAVNAETYGFEISSQYQVHEDWHLSAWYSFLRVQMHQTSDATPEGKSPRNQAFLMSSWNLTEDLEFDAVVKYVDSLPAVDVANYTSLDLRLNWRASDEWDFSVIGQNLLQPSRAEMRASAFEPIATEVSRGVYAQATWRH